MDLIFCTNCVMDGSAKEIVLDENGVCNFCHSAQKSLAEIEVEKPKFEEKLKQIRKDGFEKEYDVLIGLSGGVDSSLALLYAVENGLRPLCFSIDNGWNDPKADENIMKLVETLKVPFYRYTIDLQVFTDLQKAFIKAGQINLEIATDHILMASTYELASKYGIKWIISGGNVTTESIMPESWGYQARDLVHIKDVYKKITGRKLKGIPTCSLLKFNYFRWIKGIKTFYILDYYAYNREEAQKILEEKVGWTRYGEKHEENTFTRWFQSFYLYQKFGIDKRKAHYSSLINSKQMERSTAVALLVKPTVYPELGIEGKVMSYRRQPYTNFRTDEKLFNFISKIVRLTPKSWRY